MEQGRLLLAIVLSFAVLFIWSTFFVETPPIQPETDTVSEKTDETITPKEQQAKSDEAISIDTKTLEKAITGAKEDIKSITINTPLYSATISEKGAVLRNFVLNRYFETVDKDSDKKALIKSDVTGGNIFAAFLNNSISDINNQIFVSNISAETLDVKDEVTSVIFTSVDKEGHVIQKQYSFDPDSYLIGLDIGVKNNAATAINDSMALSLVGTVDDENGGYAFVGPSGLINDDLEQVKIKKIEEKNLFKGQVKWISIEDRYFMSSIIPAVDPEGSMRLSFQDGLIENRIVGKQISIQPGGTETFKYFIFFGPKSMELLSSTGHELSKAVNFGMFDFLAKPCLWFMNKIYSVIPNYGIAIIILTIFTKILLWPLGSKSYRSMAEMKKLQPLMTELRERYKDDKQRMNKELMSLYKTYKVNPMGGCLPMVLQIPVFFALYRMLYQAIELRHAPFLLWINDLSAPDRLFHFDFSIPFMQPPFGIPVLTIIMGGSMLLQQKMSPPPGDPTQAKMMLFMPIIFTFIFINFSSGLVLYWLTNNLLSIGQQYYVQKKVS